MLDTSEAVPGNLEATPTSLRLAASARHRRPTRTPKKVASTAKTPNQKLKEVNMTFVPLPIPRPGDVCNNSTKRSSHPSHPSSPTSPPQI